MDVSSHIAAWDRLASTLRVLGGDQYKVLVAKLTGFHAKLNIWPRTGRAYGTVGGFFDALRAIWNRSVVNTQVTIGISKVQQSTSEELDTS